MADLHDSTPPTEAWTAFQVTLNLFMLRREVKEMNAKLATAAANDERFSKMEQEWKAQQEALTAFKKNIGKYVGAAVLAAMGALGSVVVNKIAARVPAPPPPITSSGATIAPDRVPEPFRDAGRP